MSSARLRRPLSHVAHNPQQEAPPPPPPKDRETSITLSRIDTDEHGSKSSQTYASSTRDPQRTLPALRHEYGVYSTLLSRYHEPAAEPPRSSTHRPSQPLPPFKFEHPRQLDIATIRKRRDEALKQRQLEEQAAEAQERERQARIKAEKEQLARELQEQETRRRQILSEQLRHAALVRQEREERERQEEAARRRQLEARRAADKERRMRHAQQAQEWMAQRARQQEEEARRRTESRKKIQDERKARSLPVRRSMFSSKVLANFNYSGWITVQSADGVAWRRRWCKLLGNEMVITQDAQVRGCATTARLNMELSFDH